MISYNMKLLPPFTLILFIPIALFSQSVNKSSNVLTQYDQLRGADNNGLLIGEYQKIVIESSETNPFYYTNVWSDCSIKYKGRVYDNVPLLYNILEDYLLTEHPRQLDGSSTPVRLFKNQVEWFEINNHKFVYLDYPIFIYESGFYDELFNGPFLQVYSKRTKELGTNDLDQSVIYEARDVFILRIFDTNIKIKNKSAFIKTLKEHKTDIKAFIKSKNLRVKPENESDIIQLAEFCNSLLKF